MPFDSNGDDELEAPPANVQNFLTQAMAQNLQIQRQLMEQNQALQKLLMDQQQQLQIQSTRSSPPGRIITSSKSYSMEVQQSSHSHSQFSKSISNNNSSASSSTSSSGPPAPPPPPPPMPTEPIEGSRPFVDPYGRAKTVRIGKWRWPPRDNADVFLINSKKDPEEQPPAPKPVVRESFNVPDLGVVGKLRISSEMRAKLENVTGGKQNGSKSDAVRKIEDHRKNQLMEKLGGRALTTGQTDTFTFVPPPPPPPVHDQISPEPKGMMSNVKQQMMMLESSKHHHNHHHHHQGHHGGGGMPSPRANEPSMHMQQQHQQHHQQQQQMMSRRDMMANSGGMQEAPSSSSNNGNNFCLSYGRVNWALRLRKELILPWENIEQDKKLLNLLYIQILNDMNSNTLRLTNNEKSKLRQLTSSTNSKLSVVQYTMQNTEFYFVVIMPVVTISRGGAEFSGRYNQVTHVAIDLKSLKFVQKREDALLNIESRSLASVKIRDSKICESNVAIQEPYLSYLLNLTTFLNQSTPVSLPPAIQTSVSEMKTVPGDHSEADEIGERDRKPSQDDGKHSLLQFAMSYFRHMDRYPSDTNGDWTWKSLVSYVKYGPGMLQESLLQLDEANNQLALECYEAVLSYMGDLQTEVTQVECVYTLLRNCHKSSKIIDELYCQLMKQTTNNNKTGLAGWRLFTIITAYFSCSDLLKPYLFKYLEVTAYDKRRNFHGTALVALQNLRKTFKYGGRRNVPSVEEITALTAGRNAKRQIFRLPGGNDRVVNVRAATIVEDVLNELCSTLNIRTPHERQEFSLYCIVEGDTFTMPLQLEEYILDVTTELTKNNQIFYLIFCRSVWFYELKLDNPLYVEVIFNQVAPDYLEGFLVVMQDERLTQAIVYDITRIAALLHRAADLTQPPTLKETKYLLPKPALAARDLKPNQWVQMVNSHWVDERIQDLSPNEAKCGVLEILQTWPLFGSSFFTLRRINEPQPPVDYIMALNKSGVHFLDVITHETVSSWTYNQVISTRKVKNEDGVLFLDLKVGNLMQQRILRLETQHAHEISRLIRQYIHIQRLESGLAP